MKIIVFDIGGTLMEYRNMPNVWIEFYEKAFRHVREKLALPLSDEQLARSLEVLRQFNPKVNYRERDYSPEYIFGKVTEDWGGEFSISAVISAFYESMALTPYIYPDSVPALERLHGLGWTICTLTDVATGMPDELHKSFFPELMPHFDLYVSSLSCGRRKPNVGGLRVIEEHFGAEMKSFVFVGDEEKDILTAKRAGCASVLIDRKDRGCSFGQDHTIRTLNELFSFI